MMQLAGVEMNELKTTIPNLAKSKCAYDSTIFQYLYELDVKDLVSTLASSGLSVKPVHIIKSELIKPLTQEILSLARAGRAKVTAICTTDEESGVRDFAVHIRAIAVRYKKLEREKDKYSSDQYRRYLRSLKAELSDVACLQVPMSENRCKYFAREIFKLDYFITNQLLKLNCGDEQGGETSMSPPCKASTS